MRKGQDRSDHFIVSGGGGVRAASKAGAITGLGTHFLIVDDFHKAGEAMSPLERESAIEIFRNSFVNRFDNLNDARIVIIMQRIHDEDLIGWALRTGKWDYLCLPAIAEQDQDIPIGRGRIWHQRKDEVLAPAIMSRETIMEKRAEMGDKHWAPQLQQNTLMADGALVDWSWFRQYDERPPRTFFHKIVQSWDPAATDRASSDYSAGQTWGFRDGNWYLLDVIQEKLAFNELTDRMIAWHRQWRTDALVIESASIGEALHQQAKRAKLRGLIRMASPRLSKIDRLAKATVQLQTGRFFLPASAPWLDAFRYELLAFPDGRHDDQVDALSQFVDFAFSHDRWVNTEVDETGRRMRVERRDKLPRYYDGDHPSMGSYP